MKDLYNFLLTFQQNLLTVPAIVFFITIAVTVQQNKGAQDRLVAGLIGALVPTAVYESRRFMGKKPTEAESFEDFVERKNIAKVGSNALDSLSRALDSKDEDEKNT